MRELNDGEQIELGDIVVGVHPMFTHKYVVTRVTKTLALCDIKNGTGCENKFPRIYNKFWFDIKPRDTWSQTQWKAYRKDDKTESL